jgi:hypothetical protein
VGLKEEFCRTLAASIREAGIDVNCIGEVLESGIGVEAFDPQQGKPVEWPHFKVDEITRLIAPGRARRLGSGPRGEG